jgi:hypothetical protein
MMGKKRKCRANEALHIKEEDCEAFQAADLGISKSAWDNHIRLAHFMKCGKLSRRGKQNAGKRGFMPRISHSATAGRINTCMTKR